LILNNNKNNNKTDHHNNMKKLLVVAVALVGFMLAGTNKAAAQNKFGYFNLEYLVSQMPGISKVDTLMAIFEQDSLNPEYQFELDELKRSDSTLKADSARMPVRLRQCRSCWCRTRQSRAATRDTP
jgi:Skp family chaperone for outer membrane proteins